MRRLTVLAATTALAGALALPALAAAEAPAAPAQVRVSAAKSLDVDYQVQDTGYWCGPAATRIALSARTDDLPDQGTLASELGTTENGTDHVSQVTGVLNARLGESYSTTEMPDDPPSQAQKDQLWSDIVADIDAGQAIVANIVAPPGNQPPGYPPDQTIYHYFTIIGYDSEQQTVHIADPASFSGNQLYWLSFDQLSTLIPPKGYSA